MLALAVVVSVGVVSAQGPPVVSPNGVVNGASFRPPDFPGGNVAGGSLISIFGQGLGPQVGVHAGQFPLPETLGPLMTRVRVQDQEHCRLLYVSETQINCQLPANLVQDRIRLRIVTNQGQSDEIEVPIGPHGFGFFTMAGNGRGPLAAQNFVDAPDPQNRYRLNAGDNPGRPGQIMVMWGTGLGPTDPPTPAGEPAMGQRLAIHQPEVFIGGQMAQVQFAGRAPGFAGLDQIQVVVPPNAPEGCAVPVMLRQQNRISNIGTVALVRQQDRTRCVDALEPVLSGLSHGAIVFGGGLGRLGPGQLGPAAGFGGPYPPSHSPFNPPGLNAGMGGGVRSGIGGVGRTGIGAYGLHPGIPPFAGGVAGVGPGNMGGGPGPGGGVINPGPNVVTARFVRLAEGATADFGIPPAVSNSCVSYGLGPYGMPDTFAGLVERLDAGDLVIGGPGVSLTLEPQQTALGPVYVASLPTPLQEGAYMATGMGGPDVGAFGPVTVDVPQLVAVTTSLPAGTEVSRSAGLTLEWTGGRTNDVVLIHGRSFLVPPNEPRPVQDPMRFRSQAFVCTTTAGAGAMAIPSYILDGMPEGLLNINVTHMPSAADIARFEASGLDEGGVMRWIDTTAFLDLVLVP
jgi:uncharacterized protein (TIGR03437 family)